MASDVDAIWASLKVKTAPSQHAERAKALLRDVRSDGKSSKSTNDRASSGGSVEAVGDLLSKVSVTKTQAKCGTGLTEPKKSGLIPEGAVSTKGMGPSTSSTDLVPHSETRNEIDASIASIASLDQLKHTVARDVNILSDLDSNPSIRLKALQRVHHVVQFVDLKLLTSGGVLVEVFAKPILKRFEDQSERVRERAVDTFRTIVERCQGNDEDDDESFMCILEILPYAVPVLRDRLGPDTNHLNNVNDDGENNHSSSQNQIRPAPNEPSEEIRLKLMVCLKDLLQAVSISSLNALAAYASDAVVVLQYTADDAFSETVCESCELLTLLTRTLGRRLQPVAKELAWVFAPNLTHKKSKVRISALQALTPLMHCGAHETILDLCAFKHPNLVPIKAFYGEDLKVNYFGKLVLDGVPQVRLEFVKMLGDWMTTLTERTDHEPRLLPYVISAVADSDQKVQKYALQLINQLGAQYESEHEKDLKPTMVYMPEHFGSSGSGISEYIIQMYPEPFVGRPRLGARVLVKNNFPSVVNPILAEIGGWQADARVRAAKLLRANLVFLEENATQHVQQLMLAFTKVQQAVSKEGVGIQSDGNLTRKNDSSGQRAADVQNVIAECCRIIGAFVSPNEWLQVLLDMCGSGSESHTKAGALIVIAECAAGASVTALEEKTTDVDKIETTLVDKTLRAVCDVGIHGSQDTSLRVAVCRFVETLLTEQPETWGVKCRTAALVGAALRAAQTGGDFSVTEKSLEQRACSSAMKAAASALGISDDDESSESSQCSDAVITALRSELLEPLTALPPKQWRLSDAAVLAAVVSAKGGEDKFSKQQASTAIRLCSVVAERLGGLQGQSKDTPDDNSHSKLPSNNSQNIQNALVSFPFITNKQFKKSETLPDADVVLLVQTALPRLVGERSTDQLVGQKTSITPLAAVSSVLDSNISTDTAVSTVAGEIAARVVSALENVVGDNLSSQTRVQVLELVQTLAKRVTLDSVLAAPIVLAKILPQVAARLDDTDLGVRSAAAHALAALAKVSQLAAYHCVKFTTAIHLIDSSAEVDARLGSIAVLRAAHDSFPGPTRASIKRRCGSELAREARVTIANEAGVTECSFTEKGIALERGLPQTEDTRVTEQNEETSPDDSTQGELFGLE